MTNKTQYIFLEVMRRAEKPLLFGEIAKLAGLHPVTVARTAYELAVLGKVKVERVGQARQVHLLRGED